MKVLRVSPTGGASPRLRYYRLVWKSAAPFHRPVPYSKNAALMNFGRANGQAQFRDLAALVALRPDVQTAGRKKLTLERRRAPEV
jgi:hypothetical protein